MCTLPESRECRPPVGMIGSPIPGRVKPMAYAIETCHFLVWRSVLIGYCKDWLSQSYDSVISGHVDGTGDLKFQWGSTIRLSWVHTVTSHCPSWCDSWCDPWCCQDIKPPTNRPHIRRRYWCRHDTFTFLMLHRMFSKLSSRGLYIYRYNIVYNLLNMDGSSNISQR